MSREFELQEALRTIGLSPSNYRYQPSKRYVFYIAKCHLDAADLVYLVGEGLHIFGSDQPGQFTLEFLADKPVDPQVTSTLQAKLEHVDLELFRLVQAGEQARELLKRVQNEQPAPSTEDKITKLRVALWDLLDYVSCPPAGEAGYAAWQAGQQALRATGAPYGKNPPPREL
jgi:hypothetical protein